MNIDFLSICVALVMGTALGLFYFGGLWWTLKGHSSTVSSICFSGIKLPAPYRFLPSRVLAGTTARHFCLDHLLDRVCPGPVFPDPENRFDKSQS